MINKGYSKKLLFCFVISQFTLGAISANAEKMDNRSKMYSPYVNEEGQIRLPPDFRRSMVHLGSWYVPEGDASGFHDVYAESSSVDSYRSTGKWPDGATIVKELRAATSGDYTTGKGVSHANSEVKQWFVMVKDAQGRFPSNPSWGEGWGWALFKTDDVTKNISTSYKLDCLGCHLPAKNTDWIYVEGMPTLTSKPKYLSK